MAQSSVPIYDLVELSRYVAEEAFEENPWPYYRDFGTVEGFTNGLFTIRPGTKLATDHLLFIEWMGIKVGVDQYGDVHCYLTHNPIQDHLCCIIADAKATMRSDKEVQHVEVDHYTSLEATFDPRDISTEREGRIIR